VVSTQGSAPERFQPGLRVFADGERPLVIERAWRHQDELVLKFEGIGTRNEAEALRGSELRIPEDERPALPEGEYYLSDLVGCRMETTEGRRIGEVSDWQDFGAAPLLVVRAADREILVPFTAAVYRRVEPENGRIVVDLPEGLEDLNG
jgi:16S rRNA processing protein RimM